jgi:hypothetical protein
MEEIAMNKPSHRVAKAFEDKSVPLAEITGCVCAWDGCAARFTGDMPRGWINLLAYWSKRPEMNFSTIPPQNVVRDGVLCPEHAGALESQLKDFR